MTNEAREEILGRIRGALAGAPPREEIEVPRDYARSRPHEDLLECFVERVADYRAEVEQVTPDGLARAVAAARGRYGVHSLLLDGGPRQGRRALGVIPDAHICLVWTDQIVDDVPAAVARLKPERPLTWISSPSTRSDIELDRVDGVHGPRTLHVLVVKTGVAAEQR